MDSRRKIIGGTAPDAETSNVIEFDARSNYSASAGKKRRGGIREIVVAVATLIVVQLRKAVQRKALVSSLFADKNADR